MCNSRQQDGPVPFRHAPLKVYPFSRAAFVRSDAEKRTDHAKRCVLIKLQCLYFQSSKQKPKETFRQSSLFAVWKIYCIKGEFNVSSVYSSVHPFIIPCLDHVGRLVNVPSGVFTSTFMECRFQWKWYE